MKTMKSLTTCGWCTLSEVFAQVNTLIASSVVWDKSYGVIGETGEAEGDQDIVRKEKVSRYEGGG